MAQKKPKTLAPVHAGQTAEGAFRAVLEHNLDYLASWEQAARSWDDIEGVHQTRVTLRRMRSALTVFRPAVPPAVTQAWSEEMQWAGGELGLARDLDVFITEGLDRVRGKLAIPGEEKLTALAERQRKLAYEQVRAMLDSERYARFRQGFADWLATHGWRGGELKPRSIKRLESRAVPFARKVLDKRERQVLEAGANVNPDSAQEMHRLRIECKKLRYAAEFFTPIFRGMEDFIRQMKGLQDLLGVLNDVAVMGHLFDRMLEGETDPDVLRYAGAIIGWRTCEYEHLKSTFDARWEEFVHAKHPWWRKSAVVG